MVDKTATLGRPLKIRIRILIPRKNAEKMQPKTNPKPKQSNKKHIFASVTLHTLLVGLLIYFYSNFQDQSKETESLTSLIPPVEREISTALAQGPPVSSLSKHALQVASETNNYQKGTSEDSVSSKPKALPEAPQTGTKPSKRASLTRPPLDTKEVQAQKPPLTTETESGESLAPSPSKEEQNTPTSTNSPESTGKTGIALEEGPLSPPPLPEVGIRRAQFTTGIKHREPIDRAGPLIPAKRQGIQRLYYFTEIQGMKGKTITHRWEHGGKVVAQVQLQIGSNQWRTYSSKNLTPRMTGQWQVLVIDSKGKPIHTGNFVYKGS